MYDDYAAVTIKERIAGVGTLCRGAQTVPVGSFTLERAKYQPGDPWQFVAHVSEAHWDDLDALVGVGEPPIEFVGDTDAREHIRIPRVQWSHQRRGRLTGRAQDVLLDFREIKERPESQFVTIRLTPTPIALSVDRVWVPGDAIASADRRELGVRVHRCWSQ